MMPLSSESALDVIAGSMATTIRSSSGCVSTRAFSMSALEKRAPGSSESKRPSSYCKPRLVPAYLSTTASIKVSARL